MSTTTSNCMGGADECNRMRLKRRFDLLRQHGLYGRVRIRIRMIVGVGVGVGARVGVVVVVVVAVVVVVVVVVVVALLPGLLL